LLVGDIEVITQDAASNGVGVFGLPREDWLGSRGIKHQRIEGKTVRTLIIMIVIVLFRVREYVKASVTKILFGLFFVVSIMFVHCERCILSAGVLGDNASNTRRLLSVCEPVSETTPAL
jgi:hypothetical protein